MLTKKKSRDDRAVEFIGRMTTKLNRRSILSKGAGVLAAAFGIAVFGPLGERQEAFASTYGCYPPCGKYCSGCSSYGGCPTGMQTCYINDPFDPNHNCCVYSSGWWYSAGAVGERHLCRDCRVTYCPCCCEPGCCYGFCGCRSTVHY